MIQRFLFSGSGGQGVITAAVIMAEAALFGEGLNAVQTQVYGPEARGGSARSDVIVSDREILFPKVLEPNVLVCLSQHAYDRFSSLVRPGGVVVTDSYAVRRWQHASSREVELPLHETVVALHGGDATRTQGINICVLGALSRVIPVVSYGSLEAAVRRRFSVDDENESHGTESREAERLRANVAALAAGAALVRESVMTF